MPDDEKDEAEALRLDELCGRLFDMFLEFEQSFTRVAIDEIDLSDADAEAFAAIMERTASDTGRAVAYLLRRVKSERVARRVSHMAQTVFEVQKAAGVEPGAISLHDLGAAFAKIRGGTA